MLVPTASNKTVIEGNIVKKEDNNVVVKDHDKYIKVYCKLVDLDKDDYVKMNISYFDINPAENDNTFNYRNYLASLKIMNVAKMNRLLDYKKQHSIYQSLSKRLNTNNSKYNSYARMLLIGIKDDNIQDIYDNLKDLSVIHLFALSGMHLVILETILMNLLSMFFDKRKSKIIILLALGLYIYILPINISFIRAYLVLLFGFVFKKYLNKLDVLGLVAMVMLFYNPYLIYNISFIFSFMIYLIVILIKDYKHSAVFIYFGSIPIILSLNYRLSLFSVLLAYCLVPLVEVLYVCLIGSIFLGNIIYPIISLIIVAFENIIELFSNFNIYLNFSKPSLFFILSYYYFYFKAIININKKFSIKHEMIVIIALLVSFYFYPSYSMFGRVVMINVDQGDCFLIQQPFNQGNILIDTGGLRNRDVSSSLVVPYLRSIGVHQLDYVFLSHNDFDHSGGLTTLEELISCKRIIRDYHPNIKVGQVEITMYQTNRTYNNENDNSLIIKAKVNNLNYLFTGDMSKDVEYDLYKKYHHIDIDVLKVSHHGSKSATSSYLLEMCNPKVALISCGKNNVYGHPHKEVLNRLYAYGIKVYRSDISQTVTILYFKNNNFIFR